MDKQLSHICFLPINAEKRELITLFGIKNATTLTFLADTFFALTREKAITEGWPALTKTR